MVICTDRVRNYSSGLHVKQSYDNHSFAEGSAGEPVRDAMESGIADCLRSWPRPLSAAFRRYRKRSIGPGPGPSILSRAALPYWFHLPEWLAERYSAGSISQNERAFLNDVILGQYFLYLAVRIEDDLFDGQTRAHTLLLAAQRFRSGAKEIFSRYFSRGNVFWEIYRKCLSSTARHLRIVDNLQRSPCTNPGALLEAYAGVNALFTIGAAAVCARHQRMADYPKVRKFSDRCSAGTQILDDLADIREDLGRNRWNYAANVAARVVAAPGTIGGAGPSQVAATLLSGEISTQLLEDVEHMVDNAFEAIAPLQLEPAERCRRDYRSSLLEMKKAIRLLTRLPSSYRVRTANCTR